MPGGSDLLAGLAAAAVLLALVFGIRLDFWWSLGLALVTYLGVRLAMPRSQAGPPAFSDVEALRSAHKLVDALTLLARQRTATRGGNTGSGQRSSSGGD